jgi:hypothetical protein
MAATSTAATAPNANSPPAPDESPSSSAVAGVLGVVCEDAVGTELVIVTNGRVCTGDGCPDGDASAEAVAGNVASGAVAVAPAMDGTFVGSATVGGGAVAVGAAPPRGE